MYSLNLLNLATSLSSRDVLREMVLYQGHPVMSWGKWYLLYQGHHVVSWGKWYLLYQGHPVVSWGGW